MRLIAERATEAGVGLEVERAGLVRATAIIDEIRTKQVLLNLLSNAVKFTPRGGSVTLSIRDVDGGMIEIEVADTGIGMTAEEVEIAFQPFGQVDNSYSRRHQGTGLGLPLAKLLTELQGGTLTLSSAPGLGTRVTVRLPTGERAAEAVDASAHLWHAGSRPSR